MSSIDPFARAADLLLGARASIDDVGSRTGALLRSNARRDRLLRSAAFDIETAAMLLRSGGGPAQLTDAVSREAVVVAELGADHVTRRTGREIAATLRPRIDALVEQLADRVEVRRLPRKLRDPIEARIAAIGEVDGATAVRSALKPTDELDGTDLANLIVRLRGVDTQLAPLDLEHVVDLKRGLSLQRIGVELPEAWHLRTRLASVRAAHRFTNTNIRSAAELELHDRSLARLRDSVDVLDRRLGRTLDPHVAERLIPLLQAIDDFEPHVLFDAQRTLLARARDLTDLNVRRFRGEVLGGYANFVDFAEVGRIRELLRLAIALSDDHVPLAAQSVAAPTNAVDDAARAGDTIVW